MAQWGRGGCWAKNKQILFVYSRVMIQAVSPWPHTADDRV